MGGKAPSGLLCRRPCAGVFEAGLIGRPSNQLWPCRRNREEAMGQQAREVWDRYLGGHVSFKGHIP